MLTKIACTLPPLSKHLCSRNASTASGLNELGNGRANGATNGNVSTALHTQLLVLAYGVCHSACTALRALIHVLLLPAHLVFLVLTAPCWLCLLLISRPCTTLPGRPPPRTAPRSTSRWGPQPASPLLSPADGLIHLAMLICVAPRAPPAAVAAHRPPASKRAAASPTATP